MSRGDQSNKSQLTCSGGRRRRSLARNRHAEDAEAVEKTRLAAGSGANQSAESKLSAAPPRFNGLVASRRKVSLAGAEFSHLRVSAQFRVGQLPAGHSEPPPLLVPVMIDTCESGPDNCAAADNFQLAGQLSGHTQRSAPNRTRQLQLRRRQLSRREKLRNSAQQVKRSKSIQI